VLPGAFASASAEVRRRLSIPPPRIDLLDDEDDDDEDDDVHESVQATRRGGGGGARTSARAASSASSSSSAAAAGRESKKRKLMLSTEGSSVEQRVLRARKAVPPQRPPATRPLSARHTSAGQNSRHARWSCLCGVSFVLESDLLVHLETCMAVHDDREEDLVL
jgi:hypothetical protein